MLQSVYEKMATSTSGLVSKDFSDQPPYIENISPVTNYGTFHIRWYYFFGNGRIYAAAINAPESIW